MCDDRPPRPENKPPPNSMPNRPAPRKPMARPPSMPPIIPGRLKNPPLLAAPAAAGAPTPGVPGWVKVRFMGCAAPGAVVVLGGAEKVRDPREPELPPPPTRASAAEIVIANGTATDITIAIVRIIPRAV